MKSKEVVKAYRGSNCIYISFRGFFIYEIRIDITNKIITLGSIYSVNPSSIVVERDRIGYYLIDMLEKYPEFELMRYAHNYSNRSIGRYVKQAEQIILT